MLALGQQKKVNQMDTNDLYSMPPPELAELYYRAVVKFIEDDALLTQEQVDATGEIFYLIHYKGAIGTISIQLVERLVDEELVEIYRSQ